MDVTYRNATYRRQKGKQTMKNVLKTAALQEETAPLRGLSKPANKASPDRAANTKRLNINLPSAVFQDLEDRAKRSGRTMTEVIRLALGLVAIAFEEEGRGHKLVVADADGKPLREVVLPK
jgi:hypothetical protein